MADEEGEKPAYKRSKKKVDRPSAQKGRWKATEWQVLKMLEDYHGDEVFSYVNELGEQGATGEEIKKNVNVEGKGINTVLEYFTHSDFFLLKEVKVQTKDGKEKTEERYFATVKGREKLGEAERYLKKCADIDEESSMSSDAKQRALKEYYEFANKCLPADRKGSRVLCFPSTKWVERSIYKELGIPEGNIVGVENDEEKADKIEGKIKDGDWKLRLERGKDSEFFARTDEKFDVIHLDYENYYQDEHQATLEMIFEKGLLNDGGILAITTKKGREKDRSKMLKRGMAASTALRAAVLGMNGDKDVMKMTKEIIKDRIDDNGKLKITGATREWLPYAVGLIDYDRRLRKICEDFGGTLLDACDKDKDRVADMLDGTYMPVETTVVSYVSGSPMQIFIYKFKKMGKSTLSHPLDYDQEATRYVSSKLGTIVMDKQEERVVVVRDEPEKKKVMKAEKKDMFALADKREKEYLSEGVKEEDIPYKKIAEELADTFGIKIKTAMMYAVRPWRKPRSPRKKSENDAQN